MYDDLAHLWPLISLPEDYADEARYWREAIRDGLGPGRHNVLELGVGGGNNLSHLTSDFDATTVDVSEKMLANSRRLNPSVEHHLGDMRSVRLDSTFDAVLIHDAISYLLTEDDLRATTATVRQHLAPGGLFVTAPDWLRETFVGPRLTQHGPRSADGIELTYVEYVYDPDRYHHRVGIHLLLDGGRRAAGRAILAHDGALPAEDLAAADRRGGF
jgi:hypothetical protein